MVQAKGVLPKGDDRDVLYKNDRTCGYFIGVELQEDLDHPQILAWLASVDGAVDQLTAKEDGKRVASVATGFAPTFFDRLAQVGSDLERVAGFDSASAPPTDRFAGVPVVPVDALFYVASVSESRAYEFMSAVATSSVASLSLERGYQRSDGTEPFGYKDGVRNVRTSDRTKVVYVHTEGDQPDEPAWADGGTYMVTMKIVQNQAAFAALADDAARDAVIGRTKDGTRLDHEADHLDPHDEGPEVPDGLPATSHVRRAGPRGSHDDTEIFRRGLPFVEVQNGQLSTGLHFCSFQATPAQFDTIFNDWLLNPLFPNGSGGTDALLTSFAPTGVPLVQMTRAGIYFVPPTEEDGLAGIFGAQAAPGRPKVARLAINKFVTDPSDPNRRLERGGFQFEVRDDQGAVVPNSGFTTASSGRGVCPAELEMGKSYTLVELFSPQPNVTLAETPFQADKPNLTLGVENKMGEPANQYGG